MPVDPITSINSLSGLQLPEGPRPKANIGQSFDDFGQILGTAINSLTEKENTANQSIARLAAGEDIELHQVMIAMQEADIAFQLAMEVRNKVIEAYQEVTRIQI
jgi:flagellar hook-basal body complex protein FliE